MPDTYSQLLLHIVFSTKNRQPLVTPEIAERLYPYIGGIVRAERGVLCDIGGVADHVHLYIRWRPDESVSNLMRTLKPPPAYNAAMPTPRIQLDHARLTEFCKRHRIRRLALFGSVLRDDFALDSDVDVLVEFEPGAMPGLEFFGMQAELSDLFERPVDLLTPGCIRPAYRTEILGSAEDVYVAA